MPHKVLRVEILRQTTDLVNRRGRSARYIYYTRTTLYVYTVYEYRLTSYSSPTFSSDVKASLNPFSRSFLMTPITAARQRCEMELEQADKSQLDKGNYVHIQVVMYTAVHRDAISSYVCIRRCFHKRVIFRSRPKMRRAKCKHLSIDVKSFYRVALWRTMRILKANIVLLSSWVYLL